jgi:hypothetical protein
MTGTNCDLFTHNQSRSYLNHHVHTWWLCGMFRCHDNIFTHNQSRSYLNHLVHTWRLSGMFRCHDNIFQVATWHTVTSATDSGIHPSYFLPTVVLPSCPFVPSAPDATDAWNFTTATNKNLVNASANDNTIATARGAHVRGLTQGPSSRGLGTVTLLAEIKPTRLITSNPIKCTKRGGQKWQEDEEEDVSSCWMTLGTGEDTLIWRRKL